MDLKLGMMMNMLFTQINCHPALINVQEGSAQYLGWGQQQQRLHRSTDPGVGAFSPYRGSPARVITNIPAGGELYKDYGDHWFLARSDTLGEIPLSDDYQEAELLFRNMHRLIETYGLDEKIRYDLWNLVMHHWPWEKSRTMNALPHSYESMDMIITKGIQAYHQQFAIRSIHDLEHNGRCADNIVPGPSTLKQAGQGAFATRNLSRGTIITGTPVLFLPSDHFFNMYKGNWMNKNHEELDANTVRKYQLLLNYCWHHNSSSIYLCPYGPGVNYVNHNQTLANVKMQWAPHGTMKHDASLLQKSPSVIYSHANPSLIMDLVATRDIEIGEELFMDYGVEWEDAWLDHVERWVHDARYSENYISARDWNRQNAKSMLRTLEEQEDEPYPDHFELRCLEKISNSMSAKSLTSEAAEDLWAITTVGYPCRVIEREGDDGTFCYRVEYTLEKEEPFDPDEVEWYTSNWIVREAMRFVDVPYTNDLFLDNVFRHPIGLPDELFPEAWRGVHLSPLPPRSNIDDETSIYCE